MASVQIRSLRHDDESEHGELTAAATLADTEGWPTFADPGLLRRLAAAPGTITLVALDASAPGPGVVGFAHALSNGHHAYLSVVVVARTVRGQGVGRQLVSAVFEAGGVERMDLLSGPDSEGFYERLPSRRLTGYRLFPGPDDEPADRSRTAS